MSSVVLYTFVSILFYYTQYVLKCQYTNEYKIKEETMKSYYRRIRDLREDHDLSQQQVAQYLGTYQPHYSKYERGERDIPTEYLIRLADLYETSVDYILERTDDPKPYDKNHE